MRTTLLLLAALTLLACGTSRPPEAEERIAELHAFEADFEPSAYEPDPVPAAREPVAGQPGGAIELDLPPSEAAEAPVEMVAGYRVQVFSTTNIDTAKARKADIELRVPGEWFYLEYDQPTYKIRGGNFLSRYDAERFARALAEHGYPSAWAVPQRVFKNPPPPPSSLPPGTEIPREPQGP